ncbi:MAG: DUF6063 family protein [Desulfotomaculum sp.]|nr:DUF6063 family protein [Desulfotomaculum sp.]
MQHETADIEQAFAIFLLLVQDGKIKAEEERYRYYNSSSEVRDLVHTFTNKADSVLVKTSDYLYLIPEAGQSLFQVKNAFIKREYLGYQSSNIDLYLLYFCILVLLGEFYDSYETSEATRDFLPLAEWLIKIKERINTLKEHGEEKLATTELETEWNWSAVIEYWEALDDLRETAKRQDSKQQSRLGFLKRVIRFLTEQELVAEQGNDELVLTEKAKIIVQRYFMDSDYNRGILAFMYQKEGLKKGSEPDASHL